MKWWVATVTVARVIYVICNGVKTVQRTEHCIYKHEQSIQKSGNDSLTFSMLEVIRRLSDSELNPISCLTFLSHFT